MYVFAALAVCGIAANNPNTIVRVSRVDKSRFDLTFI
jgi:hypothetical protein